MKRRLVFVALIVIGAAVIFLSPARYYLSRGGFLELQAFVQSQGFLGPLFFVVAYVLAAVFWIPCSLLTLFAGAIFGPVWGFIWVTIGANLGASAAFAVARYLAGDFVSARLRAKFPRVGTEIRERSFYWVLGLRLFPVTPFIAFNYVCGVSGVTWRPYIVGTLLGMVPGTVLYVTAGGVAGDLRAGIPLGDWRVLLSLGLLGVLVLVVPLAKKYWKA